MRKGITTPATHNKPSNETSSTFKQEENYDCFYNKNMTDEFVLTDITFDDFLSVIRRVRYN